MTPCVCLAFPALGHCRAQRQGLMVEGLVHRKHHEFALSNVEFEV